jgi:methane monooxygenase component A beta chain/propane monooxygenase small subunit
MLHVQPQIEGGWDKSNRYLRTTDGSRYAWTIDSTKLRHPDWHDFRDPSGLWERPYLKGQAEQERAIARLTDDVAGRMGDQLDPVWANEILAGHYAVWSFVEWGIFRGLFPMSREALSDTIVASILFETFDRARHSQDIVHYVVTLEEKVPGFDATGAKDAWLNSERYQPLRRLVEEIAFGIHDWAEMFVAINLCFDPIVSEVAVSRLVGEYGPLHGDVVTKLIVNSVERDRARDLAWTEEFVRMVTADDVPAAAENKALLESWIAHWTPRAIAAVEPLKELYDCLAAAKRPFADVLADAVVAQRRIVTDLDLGGTA